MVTGVDTATEAVATVNVAVVCPAATIAFCGTVATWVLLLVSETPRPPCAGSEQHGNSCRERTPSVWRLTDAGSYEHLSRSVFPGLRAGATGEETTGKRRRSGPMPSKKANVKNEKQYEALKDKGMSKERAAKIANSPGASSRGGKKSGSSSSSSSSSSKQGGTTAQKKAAGRKGVKAAARKS